MPVPGEVWTPEVPRVMRFRGEFFMVMGVASTEAAPPRASKTEENATMMTACILELEVAWWLTMEGDAQSLYIHLRKV